MRGVGVIDSGLGAAGEGARHWMGVVDSGPGAAAQGALGAILRVGAILY